MSHDARDVLASLWPQHCLYPDRVGRRVLQTFLVVTRQLAMARTKQAARSLSAGIEELALSNNFAEATC